MTPDEYLERAEKLGFINDSNRKAFLMVVEMMKSPLTLEEKREQVRKGCPELVRYHNPKKNTDVKK